MQAKLKIGQPGDVYEQEADRVAEQVMRMPDVSSAKDTGIQRKCPKCLKGLTGLLGKDKKDEKLQAKEAPGQAPEITPQIEVNINALKGGGQPLPESTRAFFEPRFGRDFSQVRVHTDTKAAESARAVNAQAYTVGHDVVFGAGQYTPQTSDGQRLIAHELTHTIQQQIGGNSKLTIVDSPLLHPRAILRQELNPDKPLRIERNFELDPQLFIKPMNEPAPKEVKKCEEFPGGSTDCEVDKTTGTPTGKVTHRIDETNGCTKPCVEQHEAVHVKQLKTFCPQLRDCYLDADKGKRSALECAKLAIFGMKERECEAYNVSVPCMEKRLQNAKECKSKENKEYGTRKLASEKCFRDTNCGVSGSK